MTKYTLFVRSFVKPFAVYYQTVVCLSVYILCVCDVGVTWHADRPRPRRLCVRWRPSPPKKGGTAAPTHFPAHLCYQTAGWIKIPLGTKR